MNKAVHALVYVILAVAGVALYFEINLFDKKELLKDSNAQLRECIVALSQSIEAVDAEEGSATGDPTAKMDVSPREAKEVEEPEMKDWLDGYDIKYEKDSQKLMNWGTAESAQLRKHYFEDPEGNRIPDVAAPDKFQTTGKGTASELIEIIQDRMKKQRDVLQKTREELKNMRERLQTVVAEYNKLPPEMRQDKITIVERDKEIAGLKKDIEELQEKLRKKEAEVEELKTEVASLKDELAAAKDETAAVKEDLEKEKKNVERLTNLLKTQTQTPKAVTPGGALASSGVMTSGDKGKVITLGPGSAEVPPSFLIIEFNDVALNELLGPDRSVVLQPLEMLLYREVPDGKDKAKKKKMIVGRVRLRQWTPDSKLITADILPDWRQADIKVGDVVIPD